MIFSDCCQSPTYWELWFCQKNPKGSIPAEMPHGNLIGDMTTCEDDYCHPDTVEVDLSQINPEYISTHEVHERCIKCHQVQD